MPVIRIKNISNSVLSLDSSIGSIPPGVTRTKDFATSQVEELSESLTALQAKGVIIWSVSQEAASDGGVEFFPSTILATKTQAKLELWVDAATGNDTNTGISRDEALATIVEAERRIPDIVVHNVIIHVGPHTGDGYAPPTFRERILRTNIDVVAETYTELYSGVIQAGSNHTKFVAPAGLGENTYRGKILEVTSGAQKGFRRTIGYNTDTELFPSACFIANTPIYGNIEVGDTFRIIEPAIAIHFQRNSQFLTDWDLFRGNLGALVKSGPFHTPLQHKTSAITFAGFLFSGQQDTENHTLRCFTAETCVLTGCEFTKLGFVALVGTFRVGIEYVELYTGLTNQTWEKISAGERAGGTEQSWVGCGLSATETALVLSTMTGSIHYGLVIPRLYCYGGYTQIRAGNIYESGITAYGSHQNGLCELYIDGKMYLPDLRVLINSDGVGISAMGSVKLQIQDITVTAVEAGIQLQLGACAEIDTAVSITAGTGVKAKTGARAYISSSPVITVTGNEIEVGNTPTVGTLAANLINVGDYLTEPDGSIVQRID